MPERLFDHRRWSSRTDRRHLSCAVSCSRALEIPCTNNHAGFPDGIPGKNLLDLMRVHARRFDVSLISQRVQSVMSTEIGFRISGPEMMVEASSLLIATGVTNRRPALDAALHAEALARGRLRYCPVCDGYEVTDQNIAVIGSGPRGVNECTFLRSYTNRVSLILAGPDGLSESERERLRTLEVRVLGGPPGDFELVKGGLALSIAGRRHRFEAVYPALGSDIHSELAVSLGAKVSEEGCLEVDRHQRTTISGLYAAGDVVLGLDQISKMGQAGVASTTIRNDLAARKLKLR